MAHFVGVLQILGTILPKDSHSENDAIPPKDPNDNIFPDDILPINFVPAEIAAERQFGIMAERQVEIAAERQHTQLAIYNESGPIEFNPSLYGVRSIIYNTGIIFNGWNAASIDEAGKQYSALTQKTKKTYFCGSYNKRESGYIDSEFKHLHKNISILKVYIIRELMAKLTPFTIYYEQDKVNGILEKLEKLIDENSPDYGGLGFVSSHYSTKGIHWSLICTVAALSNAIFDDKKVFAELESLATRRGMLIEILLIYVCGCMGIPIKSLGWSGGSGQKKGNTVMYAVTTIFNALFRGRISKTSSANRDLLLISGNKRTREDDL